MQWWMANRWKIFVFLAGAYLAVEIAFNVYYQYTMSNDPGWIRTDNYWPLIWPERILAFITIFTLAEVMRYFKESRWRIGSIYFYITTSFLIAVVGHHTVNNAIRGTITFLAGLWFRGSTSGV